MPLIRPDLRPELEPLPERMRSLPVHRGYPVPWFVPWEPDKITGELYPEFRAADQGKRNLAIKCSLCWVCGEKLGSHLAYVIGPMCGITRVTSEPACHLDCATWSARNCPFLSRPDMTRRDLEADYADAQQPPGMHLDRNPGVSCVWVCREYKLFKDGRGGYLIALGDPEAATFWACGRPATRAEIDHSVNTGLPLLIENDKNLSPDDLRQGVTRFQQLLPIS